jgi:hypothetical protein
MDNRFPTMGRVPDTGLGETEAVAGLDEERFGIVAHGARLSVWRMGVVIR